jgi:hypothetical protein
MRGMEINSVPAALREQIWRGSEFWLVKGFCSRSVAGTDLNFFCCVNIRSRSVAGTDLEG